MDEAERDALIEGLKQDMADNRAERKAAGADDLSFYLGVQHGLSVALRRVEEL